MHDLWLLLRCKCDRLFWDVTQRRLAITDASGQPIGPIFKGEAVWTVNYQSTPIKATRIVQADSGSDSDSDSRRRSPRRLPEGWDRRMEADYRR